jgi:hypothetical protein
VAASGTAGTRSGEPQRIYPSLKRARAGEPQRIYTRLNRACAGADDPAAFAATALTRYAPRFSRRPRLTRPEKAILSVPAGSAKVSAPAAMYRWWR